VVGLNLDLFSSQLTWRTVPIKHHEGKFCLQA
jgi:hypothetical protein